MVATRRHALEQLAFGLTSIAGRNPPHRFVVIHLNRHFPYSMG